MGAGRSLRRYASLAVLVLAIAAGPIASSVAVAAASPGGDSPGHVATQNDTGTATPTFPPTTRGDTGGGLAALAIIATAVLAGGVAIAGALVAAVLAWAVGPVDPRWYLPLPAVVTAVGNVWLLPQVSPVDVAIAVELLVSAVAGGMLYWVAAGRRE